MNVDQCHGYKLRRPNVFSGWVLNVCKVKKLQTRHVVWDHGLSWIRVISTIENTVGRGVEFHLSVSYKGAYPPGWVLDKVRKDFQAEEFEWDDHGSKVAHLWLPYEKDKRGECPCKEEGK